MNNEVKFILTFALGAAVGSVATWKLLKTTYEQIAQEEIDSVKEVFSKRAKADEDEGTYEPTEADASKYKTIVNNYVGYSDKKEEKGGSEFMDVKTPYIIPPEKFGTEDDYDEITLIYYQDGVLAYDSNDEVVEDVDELVGPDALGSFGEYEDDSVYVRNEGHKTDYEILLSLKEYSDPNLSVDE